MYKKILLASAVATLLFSGCSSRQYYEPEHTTALSASSMGDNIVHFSRDTATLASGKVLTKNQAVQLKLEDGFYFINHNKKVAITADLQGNCNIVNQEGTVASAKFPEAMVAGTLIGPYLIYVLQNNNYGIYDFQKQSIIFNNKSNKAYAIDRRIANPLQVDKLVVIPTLDGKLVILDLSTLKVVKEMYVSTESSLNNIIFLGKLKNTLIAATPNKVLSVSARGKRELDTDISEVIINSDDIYIFAKDGRILKTDERLTILAEKKFKFAHFSVAAVDESKVYALDKQGYLIVANRNLTKHKVYSVDEVEGYAFVSGDKIYYDGEIIDLSQLNYE